MGAQGGKAEVSKPGGKTDGQARKELTRLPQQFRSLSANRWLMRFPPPGLDEERKEEWKGSKGRMEKRDLRAFAQAT